MACVNKVFLLGHIGNDLELRETKSGKNVTSFSLATSKKIDGEDRVEWHKITAWNKTAKVCCDFLSKGSQVHIEGELQTREWEDGEGNKKQTTEIIAHNVTFIGQGKGQGGSQGSSSSSGQPASSGGASEGGDGDDFSDDDIPFS